METQTHKPTFKRTGQIGFSVISFEKGETKVLKIVARDIFNKRDGETLEYVDTVNLETGEEGRLWLDGALRFNIDKMIETKGKLGFALEIKFEGKKDAVVLIDGKYTEKEVNTYKMWEVDESTPMGI